MKGSVVFISLRRVFQFEIFSWFLFNKDLLWTQKNSNQTSKFEGLNISVTWLTNLTDLEKFGTHGFPQTKQVVAYYGKPGDWKKAEKDVTQRKWEDLNIDRVLNIWVRVPKSLGNSTWERDRTNPSRFKEKRKTPRNYLFKSACYIVCDFGLQDSPWSRVTLFDRNQSLLYSWIIFIGRPNFIQGTHLTNSHLAYQRRP